MKIFFVLLLIAICLVLIIVGNLYDVELSGNGVRNKNKFEDAIIDDEYSNLFHFLQISDLHLSKFKDETRIKDFGIFCKDVVGAVKPRVVRLEVNSFPKVN